MPSVMMSGAAVFGVEITTSPARHGLQDDEPEALEQRGEDQHVVVAHLFEQFVMWERRDPSVVSERCVERTALLRGLASDDRQRHCVSEWGHCIEQIGDALALAQLADEEDPDRAVACPAPAGSFD